MSRLPYRFKAKGPSSDSRSALSGGPKLPSTRPSGSAASTARSSQKVAVPPPQQARASPSRSTLPSSQRLSVHTHQQTRPSGSQSSALTPYSIAVNAPSPGRASSSASTRESSPPALGSRIAHSSYELGSDIRGMTRSPSVASPSTFFQEVTALTYTPALPSQQNAVQARQPRLSSESERFGSARHSQAPSPASQRSVSTRGSHNRAASVPASAQSSVNPMRSGTNSAVSSRRPSPARSVSGHTASSPSAGSSDSNLNRTSRSLSLDGRRSRAASAGPAANRDAFVPFETCQQPIGRHNGLPVKCAVVLSA